MLSAVSFCDLKVKMNERQVFRKSIILNLSLSFVHLLPDKDILYQKSRIGMKV